MEEKPPSLNRNLRFSSRDNSAFKWKEDKTVVGALEIKCEPVWDIKAKPKEKKVLTMEDEFGQCHKIWKDMKLHKSFVEACEGIAPETRCCGLATDQDESIKKMVPLLNKGWAKSINEEIKDRGFRIGCFVWLWSNPVGKAETVILLIRFHSLTASRS